MKTLAITAGLAALMALPAGAWTLDDSASAVSYVSIKNGEVAEPNVLSGLTGTVGEDGSATIEISLATVETYIDIRNERVREFLFKVADFPIASIAANVDLDDLSGLGVGDTAETSFELTIAANGNEASYETFAMVTRAGEDKVVVASKQPIIVYADELGYLDGIARLQEIAGLDSIQPTVPVSFTLAFTR